MLNLHRLEILVKFASIGSISGVAADLGYSPSAISQQLGALEREAGVAVIERTAHSANLTDAGRELVEHAAIILAAAEVAESRMRARAGIVSGRVSLTCIPGLAVVLAPQLAAAQRRYPALTIVAHETTSTRAAIAVLDRDADLAVIDDWAEHPAEPLSGLTADTFVREEIVLAVPSDHPLARRTAPISGSALRDIVERETWLSAPVGQVSRAASDDRLDASNAVPQRRWQFEGLGVLAALVASGAGVALLPAGHVAGQDGVTGLSLRPRMYRHIIALTRGTTQDDPAIEACLAAVHRSLTDWDGRIASTQPSGAI